MIVFFIITFAFIAFLLQRRSIKLAAKGLRADHQASERLVEINQEFSIIISLWNTRRRYVPFVKVSEYLPKGMYLSDGKQKIKKNDLLGQQVSFTSFLSPLQKSQYGIKVSCIKRGRYFLKELNVSQGDFLGLNNQTRIFNPIEEILAAPKRIEDKKLDEVLGGFLGDISVNRFIYEDPVLTAGYRQYSGREPMKNISWSQSARGNGLMVKKFDYTLEPAVSVIVNVDKVDYTKTSLIEKSYSLARTICEKLEQQGIKYDFYTNAFINGSIKDMSYIDEGLGSAHFNDVLECLARATYQSNESLERLIARVIRMSDMSVGRILITADQESLTQIKTLINSSNDVGNWSYYLAEEVEV